MSLTPQTGSEPKTSAHLRVGWLRLTTRQKGRRYMPFDTGYAIALLVLFMVATYAAKSHYMQYREEEAEKDAAHERLMQAGREIRARGEVRSQGRGGDCPECDELHAQKADVCIDHGMQEYSEYDQLNCAACYELRVAGAARCPDCFDALSDATWELQHGA